MGLEDQVALASEQAPAVWDEQAPATAVAAWMEGGAVTAQAAPSTAAASENDDDSSGTTGAAVAGGGSASTEVDSVPVNTTSTSSTSVSISAVSATGIAIRARAPPPPGLIATALNGALERALTGSRPDFTMQELISKSRADIEEAVRAALCA